MAWYKFGPDGSVAEKWVRPKSKAGGKKRSEPPRGPGGVTLLKNPPAEFLQGGLVVADPLEGLHPPLSGLRGLSLRGLVKSAGMPEDADNDGEKARLNAAKEAAQKKRVEAVGDAIASYNTRDAAVISVIGCPELGKSAFDSEANKIKKTLWERGLGKRQVHPFRRFDLTWEDCERVVDKALDELGSLGERAWVVLYAPEIGNLSIHLAEKAEAKYGDRVIVVADGYEDLRSPDIRSRDMLSRLMASYMSYDAEDVTNRSAAFINIQNFLKHAFKLDISAITDADGKTIDTLAALLKHLLASPLRLEDVWNNMRKMRESYKALDMAV